jgi:hypothetical protein
MVSRSRDLGTESDGDDVSHVAEVLRHRAAPSGASCGLEESVRV